MSKAKAKSSTAVAGHYLIYLHDFHAYAVGPFDALAVQLRAIQLGRSVGWRTQGGKDCEQRCAGAHWEGSRDRHLTNSWEGP